MMDPAPSCCTYAYRWVTGAADSRCTIRACSLVRRGRPGTDPHAGPRSSTVLSTSRERRHVGAPRVLHARSTGPRWLMSDQTDEMCLTMGNDERSRAGWHHVRMVVTWAGCDCRPDAAGGGDAFAAGDPRSHHRAGRDRPVSGIRSLPGSLRIQWRRLHHLGIGERSQPSGATPHHHVADAGRQCGHRGGGGLTGPDRRRARVGAECHRAPHHPRSRDRRPVGGLPEPLGRSAHHLAHHGGAAALDHAGRVRLRGAAARGR